VKYGQNDLELFSPKLAGERNVLDSIQSYQHKDQTVSRYKDGKGIKIQTTSKALGRDIQ